MKSKWFSLAAFFVVLCEGLFSGMRLNSIAIKSVAIKRRLNCVGESLPAPDMGVNQSSSVWSVLGEQWAQVSHSAKRTLSFLRSIATNDSIPVPFGTITESLDDSLRSAESIDLRGQLPYGSIVDSLVDAALQVEDIQSFDRYVHMFGLRAFMSAIHLCGSPGLSRSQLSMKTACARCLSALIHLMNFDVARNITNELVSDEAFLQSLTRCIESSSSATDRSSSAASSAHSGSSSSLIWGLFSSSKSENSSGSLSCSIAGSKDTSKVKEVDGDIVKSGLLLLALLLRSNDKAVDKIRNISHISQLLSVLSKDIPIASAPIDLPVNVSVSVPLSVTVSEDNSTVTAVEQSVSLARDKKTVTAVTPAAFSLSNLRSDELASICKWAVGGVAWQPRVAHQRGLRILSFDGGGTKGVLSIALMRQIFDRAGIEKPFEHFDIICGTSTGGIIAALLGLRHKTIAETELLYDEFVEKVFSKGSNMQLLAETAYYDSKALDDILSELCGPGEVLIDTNRHPLTPRVFVVASRVNNVPMQINLWRNYNYPRHGNNATEKSPPKVTGIAQSMLNLAARAAAPLTGKMKSTSHQPDRSPVDAVGADVSSSCRGDRYAGSFRIQTKSAVRSTAAAPTFFTPVSWEDGLYCDGGLVANNPTSIALQEAKALFPGVPIELVVSVGTGMHMQDHRVQTMRWDTLLNRVISSSVDTEDVHAMLTSFLPAIQYFRLNPTLKNSVPIDEKNAVILGALKVRARDYVDEMMIDPANRDKVRNLFRILTGLDSFNFTSSGP